MGENELLTAIEELEIEAIRSITELARRAGTNIADDNRLKASQSALNLSQAVRLVCHKPNQ